MSIGITELITRIGDDGVLLQNLDSATDTLNWSSKTGLATIRFKTEQPIEDGGTVRLGLVLWLDRAKVKQIISESKK